MRPDTPSNSPVGLEIPNHYEHAWRRLHLAAEVRRFEIGLFWQRSLFFWGFIGAAFVGVSQSVETHPRLALIIACFGLVCSVCWNLVNKGSKYWQEAWEAKVRRVESELNLDLFQRVEGIQPKGRWFSAKRYSVSKVAIFLSYYTCFVWACIVAFLIFRLSFPNHTGWFGCATVLFCAATMAFIYWAIKSTKSDLMYIPESYRGGERGNDEPMVTKGR